MNVIILSGGSGKRLWPLSNEIRKNLDKIGLKSIIQTVRGQGYTLHISDSQQSDIE